MCIRDSYETDQGTAERMIMKYIYMDGDLNERDSFHFCNWCVNFDIMSVRSGFVQSEHVEVKILEMTDEEIDKTIERLQEILTKKKKF